MLVSRPRNRSSLPPRTPMADGSLSRRELLRRSGGAGALLALPACRRAPMPLRPPTPPIADTPAPPDVYGAIGVRPLINARGTFTIISGSTMLPEVRAAIDAASRRYVHLDELAEAIGARLATLTQAEWGLVTSGCSAGADPRDRRVRRRRQPRAPRPHPEPAGVRQGRGDHPGALAQRLRRRDPRRRRARRRRCRPSPSSRRRSGRGRR